MIQPENFKEKRFSILIDVYESGTISRIADHKTGATYQELIGSLEHVKQKYIWDQMVLNREAAAIINEKFQKEAKKKKK